MGQNSHATQFKTTVGKINNIFFAGNVEERSKVGSIISEDDIEMILLFLENNKANKVLGLRANTHNKSPFFAAFLHTDLKADIWDLDEFKSVSKYEEENPVLLPGEFGTYKEIKFMGTPNVEPFFAEGSLSNILLAEGVAIEKIVNGIPPTKTARCDVYPIVFCGKNSYGTVLNKKGVSRTHGWHKSEIEILNQSHIAVLEVACSAYPGYDEFYKTQKPKEVHK